MVQLTKLINNLYFKSSSGCFKYNIAENLCIIVEVDIFFLRTDLRDFEVIYKIVKQCKKIYI